MTMAEPSDEILNLMWDELYRESDGSISPDKDWNPDTLDNLVEYLHRYKPQPTQTIPPEGEDQIDPPQEMWTVEDSDMASPQGWDIFNAIGSNDGKWQLQRIDAPDERQPRFINDKAAAAFVKQQAVAGDALARKAIAFLKYAKSHDVARFGLDECEGQ